MKSRKSKHHHRILQIRISLATKFQLKLIILSFWTKFAQKECFQSKKKKVSSIIEFCIFELSQNSRRIKRELTIYGTARPRGKFANENAMALLGQVRES